MDKRAYLIFRLGRLLAEFRPPVRWHRAKDWHLDEPLHEKLAASIADSLLADPMLQIDQVEPRLERHSWPPTAAHSPGEVDD